MPDKTFKLIFFHQMDFNIMSIRALSDILEELHAHLQSETISFGQILDIFHERGFGIVLLLLAMPMALPLPVPPGVNVLLASPLILLTLQQMLGRHTIWIPEKWKRKTLKTQSVQGMVHGMKPWAERAEMIIKPRLAWVTRGLLSQLIGLTGFIMALSICVPVPLTNTVPSLGIALMAAGTVMRDGLAVLAGMIIGLSWVAMLISVILIFGPEGVEIVKEFIKSLI